MSTVPSVQSQIDAMVAGNRTTVQGDPGDLQVTVSRDVNGNIVAHHETLRAPTSGNAESQRIHDSGIDTATSAQSLQAQLAQHDELLKQVSHYDSETGKPVYRLPEGSRERAIAELQLAQLKVTAAHQLKLWAALDAQRAKDREGLDAAEAERVLTEAFTKGDPARSAALKAALHAAEATEAAAAILAARRSRGK